MKKVSLNSLAPANSIWLYASYYIFFIVKVFYAKIAADIVNPGQRMEDVTQIVGCMITVC
jgi:hypothetical protein